MGGLKKYFLQGSGARSSLCPKTKGWLLYRRGPPSLISPSQGRPRGVYTEHLPRMVTKATQPAQVVARCGCQLPPTQGGPTKEPPNKTSSSSTVASFGKSVHLVLGLLLFSCCLPPFSAWSLFFAQHPPFSGASLRFIPLGLQRERVQA